MIAKQVVRRGYDRISFRYRKDSGKGAFANDYRPWIRYAQGRLLKRSAILELGCGNGLPVGKALAGKHDYQGVDISGVQVRRAAKLVPTGVFKRADMSTLRYPASSFDCVLSFYAIFHLPLPEQWPLFKRIFRWLKPGGIFLVSLGRGRGVGREKDWLGAKMFWSSADPGDYLACLKKAGFKLLKKSFIREGKGGHDLYFLSKPKPKP